MAYFSSRGPNPASPDIIKPDITAPGVQILAGNSPDAWLHARRPGELFQAIAGTSMSSPHVAGIFALLSRPIPTGRPRWRSRRMMTTARQDISGGPGDAGRPVRLRRRSRRPERSSTTAGSMFNPGLVYDAGLNDYSASSARPPRGVFGDPARNVCRPRRRRLPDDRREPQPGVDRGQRPSPAPGTVTAPSPRSPTGRRWLHGGRRAAGRVRRHRRAERFSASPPASRRRYSVTITSVDAAIDEWRLRLAERGRAGRTRCAARSRRGRRCSPAPDTVSGEGFAGSVTIPVGFGYTGEYSAAAHGPVPDGTAVGIGGAGPEPDLSTRTIRSASRRSRSRSAGLRSCGSRWTPPT